MTEHKHIIGVRPDLKFECSICGKRFSYSEAINNCELEYWRKLRHFREMMQLARKKRTGETLEGIYLPDED